MVLLTLLTCALQALSVQQQQTGDEDFFDYNNLLRHGILEAYSGILNGLSREKVNQHLVGAATVRHFSLLSLAFAFPQHRAPQRAPCLIACASTAAPRTEFSAQSAATAICVFLTPCGLKHAHAHMLTTSFSVHCANNDVLTTQGAIDFVEYLFNDKANQDPTVNKTAVALLGDLASSLTGVGALFQQKPAVTQFVREAQASSDAGLSDTADWASQVIQKSMAA